MTSSSTKKRRLPISLRGKIVYSFVATSLILLFLFGVFEVSLRLLFKRVERITGVGQWQAGTFGTLTYRWDQYHPRYGWTNVPEFKSDDRVPFQVTINSQRLRALREYSPQPDEGVKRIAVLGDSCTFGEEVNDDETVPFYLEQHLANAEVLNFGVHGFGLGQMALRMEDEVFDFHPDHVIAILLLPEDLYRDPQSSYVYHKPVFSITDTGFQVSNIPVPEASQQPLMFRHCFTAAWFFGRPIQSRVPEHPDDLLAITHAILRRIKVQCEQHNIPFTLVTIVSHGDVNQFPSEPSRRDFIQYSVQSFRDLDIDVLDQVELLEEAVKNEGDAIAASMGHWSSRGNDLIARSIAQHLSRKKSGMSPAIESDQ